MNNNTTPYPSAYRALLRPALSTILAGLLLSSLLAPPAAARNFLRFSGAGVVFPFVTAAIEPWVKQTNAPAPVIEQTGTGAGIKNFCSGMSDNSADVAMASRPIKADELAECKKNGVTKIIELPFGYDGIVIAQRKGNAPFNLTHQALFLALSRDMQQGKPKINNWQTINPAYSTRPIRFYGPAVGTGTRDALIDLSLIPGANQATKGLTADKIKEMASTIRNDGVYIDAGDNFNLIVTKIQNDREALGVLGYNYLIQNQSAIAPASVEGVLPTVANIRSKKYPLTRLLYLYVKAERLTPPLQQFLQLFLSEAVIGDNSTMAQKGLVPLPKGDRDKARTILSAQKLLPQ